MPDKKLRLLVTDDHRLFLEGIQYLLKHELQVEVVDFASNGKEAMDKAGSGNIDVILMDINMPVIDGIQATIAIKQLYPYLKIIILSSSYDMVSITKALEAGADAFVFKDASPQELRNAFKAIQHDEIYLDASVAHLFQSNSKGKKSAKEIIQWSEKLITPREHAVLKLITEGYTNQQIADTLFLSVKTVDTHRKNMLAKLKLPNTAALVKFTIENKLV